MAEREEPKSKTGNIPRKMQIICKFWMMGNCIKDEKCEYLHNSSDFPPYKNQSNSQLPPECPMYSTGFCKNGPLCKYRHTKHAEDDNPYSEILSNNCIDNIENSEILPMWFLEYFFEKPIGLIFEEFEYDNAEEIETMKADLNIDTKINIFDFKKLSSKYQQNASYTYPSSYSYSSNAIYSNNAAAHNGFLNKQQSQQQNSNTNESLYNKKNLEFDRVGSSQNLISNLSNANAENLNFKTIIDQKDVVEGLIDEYENCNSSNNKRLDRLVNEDMIELPSEKEENLNEKAKNSENSSIRTSDSIRITPANSNLNVFENFENEKNELSSNAAIAIIDKTRLNCDINEIIEQRESKNKNNNKENEELKIESLVNSINDDNHIEIQDSMAIEELAGQTQQQPESDLLMKKILSKYSFINFNFRNTNFVPNYNYSNVNNYKNYINSTHFENGYDLKLLLEDKESKLPQKNLNNNTNNNNNNNKNINKGLLGKGFINNNSKNAQIKSAAAISEQKMEEINKCVSLSNLGKSSFNRTEIMNYLLTKNYPNDIYAMKKISIVENLNLNVRYFFLQYKTFDLIRFSMETDLLIITEEQSQKYLEAQKTSDDVILIYFDDITKDFYGFSKLKYIIENHEVEEYLQESYNEVLDIFQSQFQCQQQQLQRNFDSKNTKKKFSFLQVEWLWKTKLSYDKVEILKNALQNYQLFVNSEDGQEIAPELGFYVCRLMIKRLTKDEVQEYLNTKNQLESEKHQQQTPYKNQAGSYALLTPNNEKAAEGFDSAVANNKNYKALLSNNSHASMNSCFHTVTDGKNSSKFNFEQPPNVYFSDENVHNYNNNYFNKLYGFKINNNNSTNNKGNLAEMSNMDKMFFNRLKSGSIPMQGNNCDLGNISNVNAAQFQRNFQNFYAANHNIHDGQEAVKQTASSSSNFNENQKDFSKSNPKVNNLNTNNKIKKYYKDYSKNDSISKTVNVDNNSSVNSFNSINIDKIHINGTSNNLMQKFSHVSNNNINNINNNNKINIPEEIKNNFENIIFEKINNNYPNIANLNNIKGGGNNNIVNSNTTNNNIIVTNISNLQVNISQNSYNNIESENRNRKEKSKKQTSKEKKHNKRTSSASRSRSRSRIKNNKSHPERKRDKKENKEKKKKHKKHSSSSKEAYKNGESCFVDNEKSLKYFSSRSSSGTTAYVDFPDVSWTGAITARCALIYNAILRVNTINYAI